MVRLYRLSVSFLFILSLAVVALPVDRAWSHAGHKHGEDEPTLKLPDVVAQVNGTDIKKEEIWPELKASVKKYKKRGMALSPDQEKIAAKKLIDNRISRNLLLDHADKAGIKVTDDEVTQRLNQIKSGFGSDLMFKKKLASENLTVDKYKEELKLDIKIDKTLMKELGGDIKISDEDVANFYKKNQRLYKSPEKRRASVLLIKVDPKAGPEGNKAATDTIKDIKRQVAEGKDFGELVRQYSQDTLASKGGDLGFFEKQKMFKPFSDRAFNMKDGELSDVFRTKHGYQLLQLTGIQPAVSKSLQEAQVDIRDRLKQKQIKQKTPDFVAKLRKDSKVKVYF